MQSASNLWANSGSRDRGWRAGDGDAADPSATGNLAASGAVPGRLRIHPGDRCACPCNGQTEGHRRRIWRRRLEQRPGGFCWWSLPFESCVAATLLARAARVMESLNLNGCTGPIKVISAKETRPAPNWTAIAPERRQALVAQWATLVHQAARAARAEGDGVAEQPQDRAHASGPSSDRVLAAVDDETGARAS